jgi:hypothetical protein
MVLSAHADLTGQPAETASGDSAALAISHKGSAKQWGLAVFFVRRTVGGSGFLRKRDLDG